LRHALRLLSSSAFRIYPGLGGLRISEIQRREVQRLADDMLAEEKDASTIRNALMPLRVIYRRALEDGDVSVNPTTNLRLPAVEGRRDRIVSPEEASKLLDAPAPIERTNVRRPLTLCRIQRRC
jgi:site-specific recombinase XerD